MSCPESRKYFTKKPKNIRDKTYIWKTVKNNPNLYCWIPVSKKNVNIMDLNIDDVQIQDIPPPPDFKEQIEEVGNKAEELAKITRLRKLEEGIDIVSADDPRKYPIVKNFIKKKGLKLYGGAAINMYMPIEDKFYDRGSIPDYDVYSPTPWKDAVSLAKLMYRRGYKYVEIKAGIHKGTYKVFVNLWPVADITYISPKTFYKLKTRSFDGLKVVTPSILISNTYLEIIKPYDNAFRWPKIATRQKLLLKWHNPIKKNLKCSKNIFINRKKYLSPLVIKLLEKTTTFISSHNLIHIGAVAYNTYMTIGGGNKRLFVTHYEVLSENAHSDIQKLLTKLLPLYKKLVVTTYINLDKIVNNVRYAIFATINKTKVPICFIYQLNSCTPYKYILDQYIAAIDYIKYELYSQISFEHNKKIINEGKCKLKYLNTVQNFYYKKKKVTELDNTPFQRFVITCKGPATNVLKQTLLSRWLEKDKPKKKKDKCKKLYKSKCKYPCTWNSRKKKCESVPHYYRIK